MKEGFRITVGATYLYACSSPAGCQGKRYRVARFVLAVPSYQWQVLVEALEGPDKGLWFTCSEANFASRYRPEVIEAPPAEEIVAVVPDKPAGYISQSAVS